MTSWAIVDYFFRPKPAYFTIARELRPYTVGMTRKEKQTFSSDLSAADFEINTVLEIWGTNSTLQEKTVTLEVISFDLQSPEWTDKWTKSVVLAPNSSTELHKGSVPGQPIRTKQSESAKDIIVSARLLDHDNTVLGRYSNWYMLPTASLPCIRLTNGFRPEPFKFIKFPSVEEVGIGIQVSEDGESITVTTKRPVKGLVLDAVGDDVRWSDQALDLVPGDPQVVGAIGLKGRKVHARFLGDGSA